MRKKSSAICLAVETVRYLLPPRSCIVVNHQAQMIYDIIDIIIMMMNQRALRQEPPRLGGGPISQV